MIAASVIDKDMRHANRLCTDIIRAHGGPEALEFAL